MSAYFFYFNTNEKTQAKNILVYYLLKTTFQNICIQKVPLTTPQQSCLNNEEE